MITFHIDAMKHDDIACFIASNMAVMKDGQFVPMVIGVDEPNQLIEREMTIDGHPIPHSDFALNGEGEPITYSEHGPFELVFTPPITREFVEAWCAATRSGRISVLGMVDWREIQRRDRVNEYRTLKR